MLFLFKHELDEILVLQSPQVIVTTVACSQVGPRKMIEITGSQDVFRSRVSVVPPYAVEKLASGEGRKSTEDHDCLLRYGEVDH